MIHFALMTEQAPLVICFLTKGQSEEFLNNIINKKGVIYGYEQGVDSEDNSIERLVCLDVVDVTYVQITEIIQEEKDLNLSSLYVTDGNIWYENVSRKISLGP